MPERSWIWGHQDTPEHGAGAELLGMPEWSWSWGHQDAPEHEAGAKLQAFMQEPSKGLDGRVAARNPSPTPQQPVGDPTPPQFSGRELPRHTPSKDLATPPVPSPFVGPVEGVMLE
ncbi:UNVERIFIED_CONTAM: hypothetical protein FKN15_020047 [Acipenser sinensis]